MKAANLFALFVETPDPVALVEAHKLQDTRRDITESIHKIHRAGLFVSPGFIIGFDAERVRAAEEMIGESGPH